MSYRTLSLQDLQDRQLIGQLAEARRSLEAARHPHIDAATLAHSVGKKFVSLVVAVINRQDAWNELGLDRDTECHGPYTTYH